MRRVDAQPAAMIRVRTHLPGLLALALLAPDTAPAQGFEILHSGADCVVAERFPRLTARFEPAEGVREARVHFRPAGAQHWYSIVMTPLSAQGFDAEPGSYWGFLPRPEKSLTGVEYYIEVVGEGFGPFRTPEYRSSVVAEFGACREGTAAAGVASASVKLAPPPGAADLPLVPPGFSRTGVVADARVAAVSPPPAGATTAPEAPVEIESPEGLETARADSGAAGAGARDTGGGGGLSTTTVAILAVAAGGGVGAAVGASGGGSDGTGGGEPVQTSLTGQWAGQFDVTLAADCTVATRYVVDLTQEGQNLSGQANKTITSVMGRPSTCPFEVGASAFEQLTGSVNGTSVQLMGEGKLTPGPADTGLDFFFSQDLTGTVSGNRMSGTGNARFAGLEESLAGPVRWELVRQ